VLSTDVVDVHFHNFILSVLDTKGKTPNIRHQSLYWTRG